MYLKVNDIWKKFRQNGHEIEVLKGVTFQAEKGEWLALLGASGNGKTTLLDIVGGISKPDRGSVTVGGADLTDMSSSAQTKFRRNNIGFVFQAYHILPEQNILDNVMLPMYFAGKSKRESRARAEELLVAAGLGDRQKHRPNELSGGEQQRAAIARALINDPAQILADEPTGNLDPATGRGIQEQFEAIRSKHETTIVMVTHDHFVASLADRTITLKDGRIEGQK